MCANVWVTISRDSVLSKEGLVSGEEISDISSLLNAMYPLLLPITTKIIYIGLLLSGPGFLPRLCYTVLVTFIPRFHYTVLIVPP